MKNWVVGCALLVSACGKSSSESPPTATPPPKVVIPIVPDAAAPVTLGSSPVEVQFAAWLDAFNSQDPMKRDAYHQKNFPYAVASDDVNSTDNEGRLAMATGGFDVRKVEVSGNHVAVTMKERHSPQLAKAEMDVDTAEPHRVTKFVIHPEMGTPELVPIGKAPPLDAAKKKDVIEGIAKQIDAHYVYPEVGAKMNAAIREHLAHGDYDKIVDGRELAMALQNDLRDVSHDRHLHVDFGPPKPGAKGGEPNPDDMRAFAKRVGYGFGEVERMPDNIARIEIMGFPPIVDDEARQAVADKMSQIADADAVIFDLRKNGGGSPETVALFLSYVFGAKPVHVNDMFIRETGKTEPSYTAGPELKGTRFGATKPVFVLTSKNTFSGGEEFTYDLQTLKRATIVGETTGGGAHPVDDHPIDVADGWFSIGVPFGRPINPVTKKDWEGTGVIPDVPVAADKALDKAIELATAAVAKHKK
ncbi:MAG: S41 family peptidase [Kofleriaceae bacterium]